MPCSHSSREAIYEFGSVGPVAYICNTCGEQHLTSAAKPNSARRLVERSEAVEASLPPTPMERLRRSREERKMRKDLLALREELEEGRNPLT